MGLATTAHEFAVHVPGHVKSDDDWDNDIFEVYAYADFARALDGMAGQDEEKVFGGYGGVAKFVGGEFYRVSGRTNHTHASYSGHSQYRERLAQAAHGVTYDEFCENLDHYAAAPFFDLLWFADNEGTIGPVASRRLADAYAAMPNLGDDYWQAYHEKFATSFNLAADTGLVVFA